MFHLTMFGDTQGDMPPKGLTALTLFGGSELLRPTLARRVMALKHQPPRSSRWSRFLGLDRNLAVTLFGATVIRTPTLVEEFAALRGLVQTGAIDMNECRDMLRHLAGEQLSDTCTSITLFGATSQRRPTQKQERKEIASARASGVVDGREADQLDRAINAPMPIVCDVLSRLVLA